MHICLTLGHNASAVLLRENQPTIGYEEERLSKKKSDSSFPEMAINEIFKFVDEHQSQVQTVYISHWFDTFDPATTENKYYSAAKVKFLFPEAKLVHTHVEGISHHTAHALSAQAFYEEHTSVEHTKTLIVVIDGFGNRAEVASVYRVHEGKPALIHRVHGYQNSLGLLYQYAATCVGMSGINDVYKFLGYRVHILPEEIAACDALGTKIVSEFLNSYIKVWTTNPPPATQDLINYKALENAQQDFEEYFRPVIDQDQFRSRVRVGYVVQKVLEDVITRYVKRFDYDTLLLAGGCFYNVRLNDKLRKLSQTAAFSVMPLAGDQGAGVGLAFADHKWVSKCLSNLNWGRRYLQNAKAPLPDLAKHIADKIAAGKIVNLLQSDMEFGPRSLCNTATLALCKPELVDAINTANGRTTVMPCAPVMLVEQAVDMFNIRDVIKTVGSDGFMITAHNYKDQVSYDELGGAMHRDVDGSYSGRPQLVYDAESFIGQILTALYKNHGVRAIVNTSLNIHGSPIIHDAEDLNMLTNYWREHCKVEFCNYVVQ